MHGIVSILTDVYLFPLLVCYTLLPLWCLIYCAIHSTTHRFESFDMWNVSIYSNHTKWWSPVIKYLTSHSPCLIKWEKNVFKYKDIYYKTLSIVSILFTLYQHLQLKRWHLRIIYNGHLTFILEIKWCYSSNSEKIRYSTFYIKR